MLLSTVYQFSALAVEAIPKPHESCATLLAAGTSLDKWELPSGLVAISEDTKVAPLTLVRSDMRSGGSQDGRWFQDNNQQLYFGKSYGGEEERVRVEALTNKIYEVLGVPVANTQMRRIEGTLYHLSKYVLKSQPVDGQSIKKTDIANRFIVDAWLGNWDVLGETFDNILSVPSETPGAPAIAIRIDNAGSMFWRATGGEKPFSANSVPELYTLRDPDRNAGEVFGSLSDTELSAQVTRLVLAYARKRQVIREKISQSGLTPQRQKDILKALDGRMRWLLLKMLPKLRSKSDPGEELKLSHMTDWENIIEEVRDAAKKRGGAALTLSDGELVAIRTYMDGHFNRINTAARKQKEASDWSFVSRKMERRLQAQYFSNEVLIGQIISGLKKLPDFKGQVRRISQVTPKRLAKFRPGRVITEWGVTSSSANGGTPPYEGNVIFVIKSKHGKLTDFLEIGAGESEVIFTPGTKFKVISRKKLNPDTEVEEWRITMEEFD